MTELAAAGERRGAGRRVVSDAEMSAEDYQAYQRAGTLPTAGKPAKYRARPVTIGGERYDSQAEARRHAELRLLRHAGAIRDLERQVHYPIRVNGEHLCTYVADFRYVDAGTGRVVVEDVKARPTRTRDYLLKRKLMRAVHGIDIQEILT